MKTSQLAERLQRLATHQIRALARASGVSERAIWLIRAGTTRTASEAVKESLLGKMPRLPRTKKVNQ